MITNEKIKFVCIYKMGADFSKEYVLKLKGMVDRHGDGKFDFVCFTDNPELLERYDYCIEFERDHAGWWSLPEKFRITGKAMFVGLDTVIVGSLKPFASLINKCPRKTVYMIKALRFPNKSNRLFANGIMLWNGDLRWLFESYNYVEAKTQYPLEQDYTSARLVDGGHDIRVIQSAVSGIYSYKINCLEGLPEDARIVLFHGKPRLHQLRDVRWIKENWK